MGMTGEAADLGEPVLGQTSLREAPPCVLAEIVALLRPSRRQATRQARESAGSLAYTAVTVLGRSRQRGLRFKNEKGDEATGAAIRFLPKLMVTVVVEATRVKAVVQAIMKANRTGKGEHGDGKIFVLELSEAVRVSTDERGKEAV